MSELLKPINREELMRKARERAKKEAERMWPPGWKYQRERQREEDDLAIRYYREYAGASHER